MKKNIILVFCLCFLVFNSYSQGSINPLVNLKGPTGTNIDQSAYNAINSRGSWRPLSNKNNIDGTPLVFEGDNNKLVIFTKDNKSYKIPKGNYNAQLDKFISNFAKDSIFIFRDSDVKYAVINNITVKKFLNTKSKKRFYFILNEGENLSLLKAKFTKIKAGTINVMTKEKLSNDKYTIKDKYFITRDNTTVESFVLKKKSILKLMNNKKSEIQEFVKQNKLSYKDENDVIKIFKHYNTI